MTLCFKILDCHSLFFLFGASFAQFHSMTPLLASNRKSYSRYANESSLESVARTLRYGGSLNETVGINYGMLLIV